MLKRRDRQLIAPAMLKRRDKQLTAAGSYHGASVELAESARGAAFLAPRRGSVVNSGDIFFDEKNYDAGESADDAVVRKCFGYRCNTRK